MSAVDPKIEKLLNRMQSSSGGSQASDDLRDAIASSPYLSNLLAKAIAEGQIERIRLTQGERNAGSFQDEGKILNVDMSSFADENREARLDLLTQVVAHETMHGVLADSRKQALKQFNDAMDPLLQNAFENRDVSVDLTTPARAYLDFSRRDEAHAELTAFKALASRIKTSDPEGELDADALMRRANTRCVTLDSLGNRSFVPGLTVDSLEAEAMRRDSVEAVERCFYDGSGTLGRHGNSDYRNHYGTNPIENIASKYAYLSESRRPPDIRLDLNSLGLDPAQLERNGLNLGDLKSLPILDLGKDGHGLVSLQNTTDSRRAKETPLETFAEQRPTPDDPDHPDHALHQQIRTRIEQLDLSNGRTYDATSERLTASLLTLAKNSGLERVDHVVVSISTPALPAAHNIFVVQGRMDDPAMLRAHMPTADAAQRPVQESHAQLEAVNLRLSEERSQQQIMDQQRNQEQPRPIMQAR